MYTSEFYISNLIAGHVRNELNALQKLELQDWIELSENNRRLFLALTNEETLQPKLHKYAKGNVASVWNKTLLLVNAEPKAPKRSKLWPRITVAAAAVTVITFGIWFYKNNRHTRKDPGSSQAQNNLPYVNHITPGKNRATLSLNGRSFQLNEARTGVKIDNNKLTYNDGSDLFADISAQGGKAGIVTATTPRGGTYKFVLEDGTSVWLNAASKLEFYSSYKNRKQRIVKLEGEGYFEVAKDKTRPFIVQSADQSVQVLGTHFNINAYKDEKRAKTTLIEGSVLVFSSGRSASSSRESAGWVVLKPNQQSTLSNDHFQVGEADPAAIAWVNGKFQFDDTPLVEVMRQIARWYDVEVVYPAGVPDDRLTGGINRNLSASEMLRMLERMHINFRIEGKKIIIKK